MMTTLAFCLHLAAMPSRPVKSCRAPADVTTFTAADGKPGSLMAIGPEDEKELEAANRKEAAPLVFSYNAAVGLLVLTPGAEPWLTSWLGALGSVLWSARNIKNLEAAIARERANPSGVVDLRELHDDGDLLATERENLKNAKVRYRALAGLDVPAAVLP